MKRLKKVAKSRDQGPAGRTRGHRAFGRLQKGPINEGAGTSEDKQPKHENVKCQTKTLMILIQNRHVVLQTRAYINGTGAYLVQLLRKHYPAAQRVQSRRDEVVLMFCLLLCKHRTVAQRFQRKKGEHLLVVRVKMSRVRMLVRGYQWRVAESIEQ